jgi:hypothetical protein
MAASVVSSRSGTAPRYRRGAASCYRRQIADRVPPRRVAAHPGRMSRGAFRGARNLREGNEPVLAGDGPGVWAPGREYQPKEGRSRTRLRAGASLHSRLTHGYAASIQSRSSQRHSPQPLPERVQTAGQLGRRVRGAHAHETVVGPGRDRVFEIGTALTALPRTTRGRCRSNRSSPRLCWQVTTCWAIKGRDLIQRIGADTQGLSGCSSDRC